MSVPCRPNILILSTDQHRYDCIGYARDYPVKTPNLDRLAQEGMAFTNAFTPAPLCCPARQSLFSGRRAEATGGYWNYDMGFDCAGLEPEDAVWSPRLEELGYNSAYIGKWHVHPEKVPTDYGYQRYFGYEHYDAYIHEKYGEIPTGWFDSEQWFFGSTNPLPLEDTPTHYLGAKAMETIREFAKEGKPWHVRLDFVEPHLPCQPAEPFASMYDPAKIPKWRSFEDTFEGKPYIQHQQLYNWRVENATWEDWSKCVARYYATITQMDHSIGRVLELLRELNLEENTLILYMTDHGDMCGGHRMVDKLYVMYDDVLHIPTIACWKGVIPAGTVCDNFVVPYLDMAPTLLELWGENEPEGMHGRSLLPLLMGQEEERPRAHVVSTYNGNQFGLYVQRSLRTHDFKYIWNLTDVDELYDLRSDPEELTNCIRDPQYAEVLADLRRRLHDELKACGDSTLKRGLWLHEQLLEGRKLS